MYGFEFSARSGQLNVRVASAAGFSCRLDCLHDPLTCSGCSCRSSENPALMWDEESVVLLRTGCRHFEWALLFTSQVNYKAL